MEAKILSKFLEVVEEDGPTFTSGINERNLKRLNEMCMEAIAYTKYPSRFGSKKTCWIHCHGSKGSQIVKTIQAFVASPCRYLQSNCDIIETKTKDVEDLVSYIMSRTEFADEVSEEDQMKLLDLKERCSISLTDDHIRKCAALHRALRVHRRIFGAQYHKLKSNEKLGKKRKKQRVGVKLQDSIKCKFLVVAPLDLISSRVIQTIVAAREGVVVTYSNSFHPAKIIYRSLNKIPCPEWIEVKEDENLHYLEHKARMEYSHKEEKLLLERVHFKPLSQQQVEKWIRLFLEKSFAKIGKKNGLSLFFKEPEKFLLLLSGSVSRKYGNIANAITVLQHCLKQKLKENYYSKKKIVPKISCSLLIAQLERMYGFDLCQSIKNIGNLSATLLCVLIIAIERLKGYATHDEYLKFLKKCIDKRHIKIGSRLQQSQIENVLSSLENAQLVTIVGTGAKSAYQISVESIDRTKTEDLKYYSLLDRKSLVESLEILWEENEDEFYSNLVEFLNREDFF